MNCAVNITDSVYWLGMNDRETHLFENVWPLENGVSYNSYIIVDEKITLVDTVKETKMEEYIHKIKCLIGDKKIDYLIINHMEPDHSGCIKAISKEYPEIKIVGNAKTFGFLKDFYGDFENLVEIKDGEELNIGERNLKFFFTPMVHWPETMMTYDMKTKVLFTGDAFGSFGTLDGGIFDDELNLEFYESEMRRYYSNIVGKFGMMVQKAMQKVSGLDIKVLASTHGPVWRTNLQYVLSRYDMWSRFEPEEKDGVVVIYGSMYGNTRKMADIIARSIAEEGIKNVKVYDSSKTHLSYIINEIFRCKGIIMGSCAYNANLYHPMEVITNKLKHTGVKNRLFASFGTYAWSGGGVCNLDKFAQEIKWEVISESVEAKCSPNTDDIEKCVQLGKKMAEKIKEGLK